MATGMKIKVHLLHCGFVEVDEALPFSTPSWNPLIYTLIFRSKKNKVWLPVSAYLIEHPKGLVLIDTGWHTDVRVKQFEHLGLAHWLINKAKLPKGKAIHEQLAQLGYQPSDIDFVILSHLHTDHVSGLELVEDAKRIYVSDIEWQEAHNKPIRYVPTMWKDIPVETFSFSQTGIGPEGLSYDLFKDGTLVFVNTPAQTRGLTTTIVNNNGNFLLLTSDMEYQKKTVDPKSNASAQGKLSKFRKSLQWVASQSEKPNCLKVLANHDRTLKPSVFVL
jgi:N-acyl homoserine lactone hydrolase